MALDEPRDDDTVFTESGVTYLVNKDLYDQVKPIKVDFVDTPTGSGFHVTSSPADPKDSADSKNCCGTCSCS
jgi:iron-sulfur cluster assembly protein